MSISLAVDQNPRRRIFELETLYEIGRECASLESIDDMLRVLLSMVMGAYGSVQGLVFVGTSSGEIEALVARGAATRDDGVACLQDCARHYLAGTRSPADLARRAGMEVWLPLRLDNVAHGALVLGTRLCGESYSESDRALLSQIVANSCLHLRNARLRGQLQVAADALERRVRALAFSNEMAIAASRISSLPRFHQFLLDRLVDAARAEAGVLAIADAERRWTVVARHNLSAVVGDPTADAIAASVETPGGRHASPGNEHVVVLGVGPRTYGAAWLTRRRDADPFDVDDRALLGQIGAQAGLILENVELFERFLHDQQQQFRMRGALEQYVAPSVVDRMLSSGSAQDLRSARTNVTVLMADMRGSTELANGFEPETVLDVMDEYFSGMIEILFQYEGTIDRIEGDAIVALFGAPEQRADDAVRAVRAGMALEQAFGSIAREWRARMTVPPGLGLGVGIATGEVVAANIGTGRHLHYTTTGPTINLASRLAAKAPAGCLLLDAPTWRQVSAALDLDTSRRPRKPRYLRAKGFASLIPAYRLTGPWR
jgi:class 3 adenylate cyclase